MSAPLGTVRHATAKQLLKSTTTPCIGLAAVAEEVAGRSDIAPTDAVRILLAIVRSLSAPTNRIERIDDVDRLALTNPQEFDRLLTSYWLLLGARRPVA